MVVFPILGFHVKSGVSCLLFLMFSVWLYVSAISIFFWHLKGLVGKVFVVTDSPLPSQLLHSHFQQSWFASNRHFFRFELIICSPFLDIYISSTIIYPICLLCSIVCLSRQAQLVYWMTPSPIQKSKTPTLKLQIQNMCKNMWKEDLHEFTPEIDSALRSHHRREPQATSIGSSIRCPVWDCTSRSLPGVAASS